MNIIRSIVALLSVIMLRVVVLRIIVLSVQRLVFFNEGHHAECHYD